MAALDVEEESVLTAIFQDSFPGNRKLCLFILYYLKSNMKLYSCLYESKTTHLRTILLELENLSSVSMSAY